MTETTGPDIPEILCYIPDGCCGWQACDVDLDNFICQMRSLLPEGDVFNNTKKALRDPIERGGTATVGCARVGCEQLVMGSCCPEKEIPCDDDPFAPQLAVVDSFAAVAFTAIRALCDLLCELDPCCATITLKCWAARMNIPYDRECTDEYWSDELLKFLVCLFTQLKGNVMNWEFLSALGKRFGADMKMRWAGDITDCDDGGTPGWWTMARSPVCPPRTACPAPTEEEQLALEATQEELRLGPACETPIPSLNIIMCPSDIVIPPNCNLAAHQQPIILPHDPEYYRAWNMLLPMLLPRTALWCIYECDPANCIQ